ncbi:MAG TPA: hypothetical protein VGQ59_16505 [Cyclobacteriaceae bacterium]|jgi:hypothetical protein|nr:hypothetical protein [Cyclobacteriaceae bacterium]
MLNSSRPKLADISLISLALFYIVMFGGGCYEQLTITNLVTSAPPKSLYILQGPYGFKPMIFWIIFRPITILLYLLTLIANWNYSVRRRKLLLLAFSIDLITTVATFTYFAPETGVIAGAAYHQDIINKALLERAQLWKNLNWLRISGFCVGSILLLTAINQNQKLNEKSST